MLKITDKEWREFAGMLAFTSGLMPFMLLLAIVSPFVSSVGFFLTFFIWIGIVFLAVFCGKKVNRLPVAIWSFALMQCSVSGLLLFLVLVYYLSKTTEINLYSIFLSLSIFLFFLGYVQSKRMLSKYTD